MYLSKFGQNSSTDSEDNARKPYIGQFKVSVWPWKLDQGPDLLFPSSQQCIFASLVKLHQLFQKIMHGNHILDISKCRCDLENKVKVSKFNQLGPSQQCIYLSLVKIHQLVQKIRHGNTNANANRIGTKNNMPPSRRLGRHNLLKK